MHHEAYLIEILQLGFPIQQSVYVIGVINLLGYNWTRMRDKS